MSHSEISTSNRFFTFLGGLGAILIFALILFIAYLPNRPEPVDAETVAERQRKADEARAAGQAKLSGYAVEAGVLRIPIDQAMELTVKDYSK